MSWYSGIFDFFRSTGTYDFKSGDPLQTASLSSSNPLELIRDSSGKKLSNQQQIELDKFKKELARMGKDSLRGLLKQFYFELKDKAEMHKTLYDLRNNDVVQTIVDVMIDDGLISSNNNKIFNIVYKGEHDTEDVQIQIDKFVSKFKLDQVVLDFIDEAIILGEYILPIEVEQGKGVTKLKDNPYMVDMLAVYEGQEKVGFLRKTKTSIIEYEKDQGIHFLISGKKVRVEVNSFENHFAQKDQEFLEKNLKVGKSMILPIVNKLKQLEILEMANLALDLKRILAPVLVMVGMPENTQVGDIGSIVDEYEKVLGNMFKTLGGIDQIQFNDVLSVAGEIKVLPSIGNTKGSISTLDIGNEKDSNQEKAEALRKSIALLIGIPFYYLSLMGENSMSRLESLKLFSRYSRKLNAMQDSIINGVKELLFIHLKNLSHFVSIDDIHVQMRQITNVELLDSMEYLVALITALQELVTVLTSVSEATNGEIKIDSEKLIEFLNKLLSEFPDCEQLLKLDLKSENNPNNKFTNLSKKDLANIQEILEKLGESKKDE